MRVFFNEKKNTLCLLAKGYPKIKISTTYEKAKFHFPMSIPSSLLYHIKFGLVKNRNCLTLALSVLVKGLGIGNLLGNANNTALPKLDQRSLTAAS